MSGGRMDSIRGLAGKTRLWWDGERVSFRSELRCRLTRATPKSSAAAEAKTRCWRDGGTCHPLAWLRKTGHAGLILLFSIVLTGCTKTIDFQEEVVLDGSGKVEILKRRYAYEYVFHQYRFIWAQKRSEIFLFDKSRPVWSADLKPLYLERLPDNQGYLLVAGIDNPVVCIQRDHPSSYYVAFHLTKDGTQEIPFPKRLDGTATNLLLPGVLGLKPANGEVFTLPEKEKLARLYGSPERMRRIILSSKYGC